ncbi:MAG: hypothetical protein M3463_13170 [Verrucomicrobiota bacterium]|nr:hypothetical protein [Verrucomicrobiota bacterium]
MSAPPAKEKRGDEKRRGGGRSVKRKLAEWVSLGISAFIVLSLAGYLVYEAAQPNDPRVPIEVHPLLEEAREESGRHILPVRISNRGQRTVRDLKIELVTRQGEEEPLTLDITIDYLGERSEHTVYFYLDAAPRSLELETRPASYALE